MAEQANNAVTATPPASSGGTIDLEKLLGPMGQAVATAVAEAIKPLSEAVGKLASPVAVAAPVAAPSTAGTSGGQTGEQKPLSAGDVTRIVTDALASHAASQASAAARTDYIARHLPRVPAVYHAKLGTDPARWEAEAAAIQAEFAADWTSRGGTLEMLGGAEREGGKGASQQRPDVSKLPAFERIHLGLEKLPLTNTAEPAGEAPGPAAPAPQSR